MKTLCAFLAAATFGTAAYGMTECAGIENDLDRLACYDAASGRTPVSEVIEDSAGNWRTDIETSEFKDTTDVYLTVDSDEPLTCGMFGTPQRARLMLRCLENTTSLYFVTNCHLASGFQNYGRVEYRIDDRPSGEAGFSASTDNSALGLWRGGSAIPMIKRLIGADSLLIRFTPFNESRTTARFTVTGLDEAVTPLREACNW